MNTSSDVIWLVAPSYINSFAYVFFMVSIFAASSRQHLTISSLSSCSSFIRFLFTPASLLTPAANCDRGWSCKRGDISFFARFGNKLSLQRTHIRLQFLLELFIFKLIIRLVFSLLFLLLLFFLGIFFFMFLQYKWCISWFRTGRVRLLFVSLKVGSNHSEPFFDFELFRVFNES